MRNQSVNPIAIVLCGSGYRDGSEIGESVAVLWALSVFKTPFLCFAPDAPQTDVVNCLTQGVMKESRNMLIESARIARGQIKRLETLDPKSFSGIILPGGFGAAKNLCTFAEEGAAGTVNAVLHRILNQFFDAGKPIGAICIAPVIIGLALRRHPLELSVGRESDASRAIEKMGHRHVETRVEECHIDAPHSIVTTPAYMYDNADLGELFEGVRRLVGAVIELGQRRPEK